MLESERALEAMSEEDYEQLLTPPKPDIDKPWNEYDVIAALKC